MWNKDKIQAFRQTLLSWYDQNKRDLPWRKDHDPYHVMVSEIMLQQTQVNTVIPYYQRFMAQFPTVQDLADAPEDQVLKAWEGLGYYSRARNLQKAANQIAYDHAGVWPETASELTKLAGIGLIRQAQFQALHSIKSSRPSMAMPFACLRACFVSKRISRNLKRAKCSMMSFAK